jgi:hypothetical protein
MLQKEAEVSHAIGEQINETSVYELCVANKNKNIGESV